MACVKEEARVCCKHQIVPHPSTWEEKKEMQCASYACPQIRKFCNEPPPVSIAFYMNIMMLQKLPKAQIQNRVMTAYAVRFRLLPFLIDFVTLRDSCSKVRLLLRLLSLKRRV